MRNNDLYNLLRRYWPALILSAITFAICMVSEWELDSIEYRFFIPEESQDGILVRRLHDLKDVWISQCNHYQYYNGRFLIHFLVQIFCGLLGKFWFALFNSLVTGGVAVSISYLVKGRKADSSTVGLASTLLFILFCILPYEPPFQLNYVWSAFFIAVWAIPYFRKENAGTAGLILYFILGFMAGECNESFSIPVCVGIICHAIVNKFRLSKTQWVGAIAFGLGSILLIIAPSNWQRFDTVTTPEKIDTLKYAIESALYGLPIPALYVAARLMYRRKKPEIEKGMRLLISVMAVTNYLLAIYLMFCSGTRMIIAGSFGLTILFLAIPLPARTRKILVGILTAVCIVISAVIIQGAIKSGRFMRSVFSGYATSDDGRAIISDDLIFESTNAYFNLYAVYNKECRFQSPGKPDLRLRPASLRNLKEGTDTNMLIKVDDESYLIVQSREHPAVFTVEKELLPGIMGRRLSPRVIDFAREKRECIDSTSKVYIGIYRNDRFYLGSEVRMTLPDTVR